MTDAQKKLAKLQIEQSEVRQKLNELLTKDERSADESTELETLTKRAQAIEPELRAALVVCTDAEAESLEKTGEVDAETRERLELRSKCSVTRFVEAALGGGRLDGAEVEYMAAEGVTGIPLALFDEPETRKVEQRADVATDAPGTVGVNLQPIRPAIFSESIAPKLRIEMPRTMSGTYAEARIDTSLTAGAQAQGDTVESTAATFAVVDATPKRISGRLGIQIEDIARVGQANFESALRNNLMLVMSAELDNQAINGAGQNNDLTGIFARLTDPGAPSAVATFDEFIGKFADAVDGLWASMIKQVAIVAGPATYQLSGKTFQSAANYKGEISAASYLMDKSGGWWTNKRMPAADSDVQQAIVHRMGRMGLRTAVCPHWGSLQIDDVYSGSASGTRYLTFHILVGDVILVQPDAYAQVSYQLA